MILDLEEIVKEQEIAIKNSKLYDFIEIVGNKDKYTEGHSIRVAAYSVAIGKSLGFDNTQMKILQIASLYHDIGKIKIPDEILTKESPLTKNEWLEMQKHAAHGEHLMSTTGFEHIDQIITAIKEHHERYDGKMDCQHPSYIGNLSKEDLSIYGRIIRVADAYDAMSSDRTYRNALPLNESLKELKDHAGTEYDPTIVKVFLNNEIYQMSFEGITNKRKLFIHKEQS